MGEKHRDAEPSCCRRPAPVSSLMFMRLLLLLLWTMSAQADFFQLDSISNVSTYYFNYLYCNIWEGDCQPHQDDATQQGKTRWQSTWLCNLVKSLVWPVLHPHDSLFVVIVPTRDLWAGVPQDYISLLHQWYCSLGQCCDTGDCRISNNITGICNIVKTLSFDQSRFSPDTSLQQSVAFSNCFVLFSLTFDMTVYVL